MKQPTKTLSCNFRCENLKKKISGNNNINREKDIIPNSKKKGKKGNRHVPKPYPKNITVVQKYNCS